MKNEEKIEALLKALFKIDESKRNEAQEEFFESISDKKINLGDLMSNLNNEALYNGLDTQMELDFFDLDPENWGISIPENYTPDQLNKFGLIDLGKGWDITKFSIDIGPDWEID